MAVIPCVIFDLDGTLANIEHRLHFLKQTPPNWKSFFAASKDDTQNGSVVQLLEILWRTGETIFICSGRPEEYRPVTEEWLKRNLESDVTYTLRMRPAGDFRPDYVVKKEMLDRIRGDGYEPWLVVDDRQSVVDMWRANGLTCLQMEGYDNNEKVWPGGELHIMIGPSCSGKTTWLGEHLELVEPWRFHVVSSDGLREHLCGDWRDQSKNEQVFDTAHAVTKAYLVGGCRVMFDATNLKRKDRLALVNLAPKGTKIVYHVFDGVPVDVLKKRAKEKGIPEHVIDRHVQTYNSQRKDILDGDGLPNVEVVIHKHGE